MPSAFQGRLQQLLQHLYVQSAKHGLVQLSSYDQTQRLREDRQLLIEGKPLPPFIIQVDDEELLRVHRHGSRFNPYHFCSSTSKNWSRFTFLRIVEGTLYVCSTRAGCDLEVVAPALWDLLQPGAQVLGEETTTLGKELLRTALEAWGYLESDDERSGPLKNWEFHEALFHYHSSLNFTHGQGATFRFKPDHANAPSALAEGFLDLPVIEAADPYAELLELRHSELQPLPWASPFTPELLSQLLAPTCRDRPHPQGPGVLRRGYPSAGGLHSLNFYLVINHAQGIPAGVYRYLSATNQLAVHPMGDTATLNQHSQNFMGSGRAAPLLIIITGRPSAVAWKYETVVYRYLLLEAGAVMQSLYAQAAQLGLPIRPRGASDTLSLAQALGLDDAKEPVLLQLELGSRKNISGRTEKAPGQ